ncbi:UDP-N-acetylenolpyruvoylglucosamine reductase [Candidatus Kinetoplastibacterium sorsogonicusi]|uniref:UDP-N-acetylenolpyruvoylglucosamine reductase n=1 Tax=Candidatus Kinetoplastidibacterium kentomonadis TaxID=1576550 RepID=A0A3Q8F6U1_9PROT|nr:UDP-N-acetylmuramate dehydrogenase [Candidatus Kinetoplastibacterium sorsogonicusi]AWD32620.1 UDP-N-acetylenolpyruvoylglucosamine reductase [Candidatus Kinetoplastibacterium sorsogonicusi]
MDNLSNNLNIHKISINKKNLRFLNTLGLNSIAESYINFDNFSDIPELIKISKNFSKIFCLGSGSNVVLSEYIYDLVIKVNLKGIEIYKENHEDIFLKIAAGELWNDIVFWSISNRYYGLENLALIPGTVGAAPIQNIGAYGVEFCDYFHSLLAIDIFNGKLVNMYLNDCKFSYRNSIFKLKNNLNRFIVLSVTLKLKKYWVPNLNHNNLKKYIKNQKSLSALDVYEIICNIRNKKLPNYKIYGNVGSFFKNPIIDQITYKQLFLKFPDIVVYTQNDFYKVSAGWLIEKCGFLGKNIGNAYVDDKHALIIINKGNAKAIDIINLASAIQSTVLSKFGILLEKEPVYV